MKNKGFTMVELLAVIAILGILTGIAVMSFEKYTDSAKKNTYIDYEKTMEQATINYFMKFTSSIPSVGSEVAVTAETLIEEGYLSTMKDPTKREETCDLESYVVVRQEESVNGFNMNLIYTPCLICPKYKSSACPSVRPSNVK